MNPEVGPSTAKLLRRLHRDERGISLIEVMMVASIMTVVLGSILVLSETTAKLAPNDDERALVMQEARTGVHGMSREVRQAISVLSESAYSLRVQVRDHAGNIRDVTYACNVAHPSIAGRSRCTRTEGSEAAVIADHVVNQANGARVFTRNGNHIRMKLQVAAAGDRVEGHKHTITLDDGAYMRNHP